MTTPATTASDAEKVFRSLRNLIRARIDSLIDVWGTGVKPVEYIFFDDPQTGTPTFNYDCSPVIVAAQQTLSAEPTEISSYPLYSTLLGVTIVMSYANHATETQAAKKLCSFGGRLLRELRKAPWSENDPPLYLVGSNLEQVLYNENKEASYKSTLTLEIRYYSREG